MPRFSVFSTVFRDCHEILFSRLVGQMKNRNEKIIKRSGGCSTIISKEARSFSSSFSFLHAIISSVCCHASIAANKIDGEKDF